LTIINILAMIAPAPTPARTEVDMDPNIAAWMIAGGPRMELQATRRDREHLHAYLDSQRSEPGPSVIERIRGRLRPAATTPGGRACVDAACSPA